MANKRIVICCDGTWNTPDQKEDGVPAPTNVKRLYDAVAEVASDGVQQTRFYETGVGTRGFWDKITGGAVGTGLNRNVVSAYTYVVQNFVEGDELYLFGFSRGAYTARSLAGLIRNSGIVRDSSKIEEANDLYRDRGDDSQPKSERAMEFRNQNSVSTRIHFVGVWDTVGALGIPGRLNFIARHRFAFHDVELSSHIDHAYHALALDERRKPFQPTLWHIQDTKPGEEPQDVEQVWFAGVHCNVGGGYKDECLANHALLWLAQKAAAVDLSLDEDVLRAACMMHCEGVLRDSMTWYYRPLGIFQRKVELGNPKTNEALHESAIERYRKDMKYRPYGWPADLIAR